MVSFIEVHNERLKDMISGGSEDLDSWNSLISEIEKTYPDDSNTICLAFDSFLSKFPLCHWHWKRYAYHEARLCNAEKAVEIFERAVESTPFSVGLWVDYCTFAVSSFEDPFDIRRLFTKGISLVGKDYFCHVLWDKYMSFEFSQEKWGFLTLVYVQALRFPTKKLHKYYENFKKLVTNLEEEILHLTDDSREVQLKELSDATVVLSNKEIAQIVKDLQDPSDGSVRLKALYRYRYCGDQLYQKACQLEEKIKSFESNIQRRYFQAIPLDNDELKNWHDYLDFIEKQDDFDWALKLYERCLISCANYPEFWIRYVDFMETKGGRELAMFALERATKVFSKNVPEIHLFTARYMEQIGDPDGARASFPPINADWDSCFIQYVTNRANMEKRLGNCSAACDIYKRAINMAVKEQKLQCIPMLYIGYYRLRHMITASVEAARDVIIDGINRFPGCGLLYEYLNLALVLFEAMSGLHINMSKSIIYPVNEVPNLENLATIMCCSIGSFPTTYLGLPLGARVWKTIRKLWEVFYSNATLKVGSGEHIQFWEDTWLGNEPLLNVFPRIFQIASNPVSTISQCWEDNIWNVTLRRNLNGWELEEFMALMASIQTSSVQAKAGVDSLGEVTRMAPIQSKEATYI
ncbi:hypothetical protein H5410_007431 [Solanum commersonii]|uniref:Uncharacterized protein n=1 Tax=Solanum commersonii TaxID=4109 RepID=A0A9J6AC35_SOLCO|nr:hypothetical protein H5410_007431 [Solanum commersonii]